MNGLKLMTLTWQHSGGQSFAGSDFEMWKVFFADRVLFPPISQDSIYHPYV